MSATADDVEMATDAPNETVEVPIGVEDVSFIPPSESVQHDLIADPFDWEAYTSNYSGRARITRLVHIATTAGTLRQAASELAMEVYKSDTIDTQGYQAAADLRNTTPQGNPLPAGQLLQEDNIWIEETSRAARQEGEKLELELRNYQNNLIKESIRMANRDLAAHFRKCGQLSEALKCYQRTREFCSTNEHVVEMCLDVIEVAMELRKYDIVASFVGKAEGVLESYDPAAAAASAGGYRGSSSAASGFGGSSVGPSGKGTATSGADAIGALFRAGGSAGNDSGRNRAGVAAGVGGSDAAQARLKRQVAELEARLQVSNGIAALGQGRYESAANAFLNADPQYADSYNNLVSAADVALYGTLCAVAEFQRPRLRKVVTEKTSFRGFMEHEPHTRELLDAFSNCDYRRGLELLDKWKSRHLLDIYLHPHLATLTNLIIRRCLQQFFLPFQTVSLARVSELFGWSLEQSRAQVLQLVERKDINARLDWVDDIVITQKTDARRELFQQTVREGERRINTAEKLCFRMQLLKNGLTYRDTGNEAGAVEGGVAA